MNVEEIKKRVKQRNEHYVYEGDHEVQYHEDIEYLLFIIEEVEEHLLNTTKLDTESVKDIRFTMKLNNIIDQALQAIRGENEINKCIHDYAIIPPNEIIASQYRMCIKCHDVQWNNDQSDK